MERPTPPLPCLVVTYEELLARRRQRRSPGSTNTDKRKVAEELTGSAVSSGRDGFDKRDSSSSRARHGVLQITPTHMERQAKRSRDKSKESRARTEDRVLLSDTSGGILREWSTKEGVLENLISRWTGSPAKIARIFSTCEDLEKLCLQALSGDVVEFCKKDMVSKIWRGGHYPITDKLRKTIKTSQGEEKEAILNELAYFLTHSIGYYASLLDEIQQLCDFQLCQLFEGNLEYLSKDHRRKVKLAFISCHVCYICLGDLGRYKEELQPVPDWSSVRSYYLKAQLLVPKDGKPYNQLAVVALNAHRRLDAVYYYMRSLKAKNQFLSAHDSLMGLFDETSRKAKDEEKMMLSCNPVQNEDRHRSTGSTKDKRSTKKQKRQRRGAGIQVKKVEEEEETHGRKEKWIMPGVMEEDEEEEQSTDACSSSTTGNGKDAQSSRVNYWSDAELSRNLTQSFLVAHGKLFTKIGIESFEAALQKLTTLWEAYLRRSNSTQSDASRIVKMTAINIFLLHYVNESIDDVNSRSVYLSRAMLLAVKLMTSLLVTCEHFIQTTHHQQQQCVTELMGGEERSHETVTEQPVCDGVDSGQVVDGSLLSTEMEHLLDRLSPMLPGVRVWIDWCLCHAEMWNQPFLSSILNSVMNQFWCVLVSCINLCQECLPLDPLPSGAAGCSRLWEDKMLAGFTPLSSSLTSDELFSICDAHQLTAKQRHFQCLSRVALLQQSVRKLCSVDGAGITCDPHTATYSTVKPAVTLQQQNADSAGSTAAHSDIVEDDTEGTGDEHWPDSAEDTGGVEEEEEEEEGATASVESDEEMDDAVAKIQQLKVEKERLAAQIKLQQQSEQSAQVVIEEASRKKGTLVIVKPRYLVPDTNCFIDMLSSIQRLADTKHFVITVPLTVVAELEGLSKGDSDEKEEMSTENGGPGQTTASHGRDVSPKAQQAVEYITHQMGSAQLRVLTTQGNLLSSLTFRAEVTSKAKNDDLILLSSINLHQRVDHTYQSEPHLPTDEAHSVVLLTDDRNLRVKAHANHLPVKDVNSFISLLDQK